MQALIYDHVRTARGKGRPDGALHEITPVQLATQTLSAVRERNALDTALLDDVILGCVMPIGEQGCNIARIAALNADYAQSVPGQQLNRFCASGLEAVNLAAALVGAGQAEAIVAGGVESMSRVPIASDGGACYTDPSVNWKTYYTPQGIGADLIATQDGWTREDVDVFALESQQRAAHAWQQGWFARSVLPVKDILGEVVLARDEHLRPGARMEDLAKLKPAFADIGERNGYDAVALYRYPQVEAIRHVHTGGNSSGIVDGAAAVLIGSEAFGERASLRPRARVRAFTSIGSEPAIMLTGPAACTEKLLKRTGMSIRDIDLFEVNEAFASVVLRYMRHFDLDPARVNVNGGAIALGHPLGATGAMILGTVLDELERRDANTALITLCAAAGMATATIIERI
ncbi:acetyl-CoA acetyltransferase [Steroidobacter agaridevorans]|uniref:Acetyl-CoA acetyltransferase n=1 Tax=Steroidobacter agaridevorans TaxID=2695856 RepID=A0A829YJ25_9GAMM|nr:acetyl-CoA C-acetyltransferase [Steroidobacter agaridevorans]GFE82516.1 acetyl-CoA acetyltransferase [Steroidobacter agaridevorans]